MNRPRSEKNITAVSCRSHITERNLDNYNRRQKHYKLLPINHNNHAGIPSVNNIYVTSNNLFYVHIMLSVVLVAMVTTWI